MTHEMDSRRREYYAALGALVDERIRGSEQGLFAIANPEDLVRQDIQGLFGVSVDGLVAAGRDLWERMSPRLYAVCCDPASKEHDKLANLIQKGADDLPAAVAALLTAHILALPFIPAAAVGGVAYIAARIILETLFEAAYETGCDKWKASLPETPAS